MIVAYNRRTGKEYKKVSEPRFGLIRATTAAGGASPVLETNVIPLTLKQKILRLFFIRTY